MAVSGSGGYGGPNFSQISNDLRNIAVQFGTIASITTQIKASVGVFRDFERELTLANFAAGGTVETFVAMEKSSRNMALGGVNSVSQLANAFGNLARAGLDAKEVLTAATGVMLLANATLTDLGEAADVTASTMAQFNLQASESNRIANLFVASSNNSLASLNKLAFAMRQVGPIAAQANLSLEETVGMLDKLFDAGLRGEQAGTALRNIISRLVSPMGQGKDVLKNLGVDAVNKEGKTDIDAALRKLAGLNLSLQDASNIAGVEAASGFLTLLKSINQTNDGLDEHIKKISGTTDAYGQAMAQMATLDGSLKQAGNAFNELRLIAGEGLAPILITLSQSFVDMVLALREVDTSTIQTLMQFALMGVGIGVLTKAAGSLGNVFTNYEKALGRIQASQAYFALAMDKSARAATGMNNAAVQASNGINALGRGVLGFVGIAGGILGVAAALGSVAFALIEVQKAKDKAQINKILGDDNFNPEQARRALRNTQLSFNVDDKTGAGAMEKYAALDAQREGAQKELERAERELADLRDKQTTHFAKMRDQIREMQGLADVLNIYAINGTKQDPGVIAAAQALGNSTASNWAKSVEAYATAIEKRINESDNTPEAKQRIIANFREKIAPLFDIDADVRTDIQEKLKKATSQGAKQFTVDYTRASGDQLRSVIANIFDLQAQDYALTASQIETKDKELQTNVAGFQSTVDKATQAAEELRPQMKLQVEMFARAAFGSATDAGNANVEAIDRWVEKNPEKFIEAIKNAGGNTVAVINAMRAEMEKQGIRIQGALDNMIPVGNTPGLNQEAIDAYWAKATKGAVEGAGKKATEAMRKAARQAAAQVNKNEWREEAKTTIEQFLGQDQRAAAEGLVQAIDSGTLKSSADALRVVEGARGKVKAGFEAQFTKTVEAAILLRRDAETTAENSFKPPASTGRTRMSAGNKAIDKILDLPTEAEFQLQADEMASNIKNALSDYLNLPIDRARRELEKANLEYRGKVLELQRDFEKFWRDNVTKGLDISVDKSSIDAIAGRGFTINGKTYTPEMLKTQEGSSEYTTALLDYLTPKIPANAPEREKRIAALKRVVARLGEQSTGIAEEFENQAKIIALQGREATEAAKRAAEAFDLEQAAATLQTQLDTVTLTNPLDVSLHASVRFNLSLATLKQGEASQIAALQDQYKERIAALNISVEAKGNSLVIDHETNKSATADQIVQANALIDAYNHQIELIRELTQAKVDDATVSKNSYSEMRAQQEEYIEALRRQSDEMGRAGGEFANMADGMRAGFEQVAHDLPTYFEVAMDSTEMLLNGLGDSFSNLFTDIATGAEDWDKKFQHSIANVLASVGAMIAKMLVMAATMQLIRLIPGGDALLAFMDAGANLSKGVSKNAYGGVHDHEEMARGGIKQPGQTSMAIFGEGQWPEAFMPMVDGKTIPVAMGADGRYYIQLPSGQTIPVSMQQPSAKKFAYGGTSLNFGMNKAAADSASRAVNEGSTYSANGRSSEGAQVQSGNVYNFNSYVTLQGSATAEDADKVAKANEAELRKQYESSKAEEARQAYRNRHFDPKGF